MAAQTSSENSALTGGKYDPSYQAVPSSNCKRASSLANVGRRVSSVQILGMNLPPNIWSTLFWGTLTVLSSVWMVIGNNELFSAMNFPKLAQQELMMIFQLIVSFTLGLIFDRGDKDAGSIVWPRFSVSLRLLAITAPLAAAYVFRVAFTNMAVQYVDTAMYQTLRTMSIIFTVGLSWPILGVRPTFWVVLSALTIACGILIPLLDRAFDLFTFALGLAAGGATAVYLVVIKYYLPYVNNDSRALVNYNSLGSLIILIPFVLFNNELPQLWTFFPWSDTPPATRYPPGVEVSLTAIWLTSLGSCVTAFAINLTSMMLIRVSSPVTYDIFAVFKTAILAYHGFVMKVQALSWSRAAGIGLSVVGTFLYSKGKHAEHQAKLKSGAEAKKRQSSLGNAPQK